MYPPYQIAVYLMEEVQSKNPELADYIRAHGLGGKGEGDRTAGLPQYIAKQLSEEYYNGKEKSEVELKYLSTDKTFFIYNNEKNIPRIPSDTEFSIFRYKKLKIT